MVPVQNTITVDKLQTLVIIIPIPLSPIMDEPKLIDINKDPKNVKNNNIIIYML